MSDGTHCIEEFSLETARLLAQVDYVADLLLKTATGYCCVCVTGVSIWVVSLEGILNQV